MKTRKAYVAAAATALGAVLATTTPFLHGRAASIAYAVLAVLGALGITWRVPNAGPLLTPVESDAPGAPDALIRLPEPPGPLGRVLDAVPAVLAAPFALLRREDAEAP